MGIDMRYVVLVIAAAIFSTSSCTVPPDPTPNLLEGSIRKAGYSPYSPIRSNWGPGFLFTGDIGNPTPVCRNLYGEKLSFDDLENAEIVFQDIKQSNSSSFDASVDFLSGLIGKDNSAKLGLADASRTAKIDISWGDVKEYAYFAEDAFGNGVARPIDTNCLAALRRLKAAGSLSEVKMVNRAIAATSMTYKFASTNSGEVGLDASIAEKLTLSVGDGKWKFESDNSLKIERPVFLGYALPVALADFTETGEVSGDEHRVIFKAK
jgi:hypothetical protein